jgi:hypothetical protein
MNISMKPIALIPHTKEITITIPYTTFNALVGIFDLNCQDDLDQCITSFIETELDNQLEINTMDEYYKEYKNG